MKAGDRAGGSAFGQKKLKAVDHQTGASKTEGGRSPDYRAALLSHTRTPPSQCRVVAAAPQAHAPMRRRIKTLGAASRMCALLWPARRHVLTCAVASSATTQTPASICRRPAPSLQWLAGACLVCAYLVQSCG
jgi:hypothetical protein